MIRVEPKPEPPDFDRKVRMPGQDALADKKNPLPPYWQACLHDLWEAYDGICAYLCQYIPLGTGARTADHYVAKSPRRDLAYEWSNYRLACSLMNARKHVYDDVLDPFEIQDHWFELEFVLFQVTPHSDLDEETRSRVDDTIERLGLNRWRCREARRRDYEMYESGDVQFSYLQRYSPFIAREMIRQGMV